MNIKVETILLILLANCASAASYYLDATGGSDAANGTSTGTAWQTVLHASTNYMTGDTLFFKRGETWSETFTNTVSNVIFDAYGSGALPILDGGGTHRKIISLSTSASNTVTRNLHLRNGGGGTGANWESLFGTNTITDCTLDTHASDALASANADSHIIVSNCFLTGAFDDGVTLHATASALVQSCTFSNNSQGINNSGTDMQMTVNDCTFINNVVSDVGPLSACVAVFNRCRFYGRTDGAGLKFFEGSDTSAVLNYCTFNASQSISLTQPTISSPGSATFLNCVFYGGSTTHGAMTVTSTVAVTNSIIYGWTRFGNILSGSLITDHCILFNVPTNANSYQTANTSLISTNDPLFVSPSTGDFKLQAASPAINAGVTVGLTLDLANAFVSNPPDIGAYEYVAAGNNANRMNVGIVFKKPQ